MILDASLASLLEVAPTLEGEILRAQAYDMSLQSHAKHMREVNTEDFSKDQQGMLRFQGRIRVPKQTDLRKKILAEAHESSYSIHPGGTKMYEDLR